MFGSSEMITVVLILIAGFGIPKRQAFVMSPSDPAMVEEGQSGRGRIDKEDNQILILQTDPCGNDDGKKLVFRRGYTKKLVGEIKCPNGTFPIHLVKEGGERPNM